jgi:hypothetical protein
MLPAVIPLVNVLWKRIKRKDTGEDAEQGRHAFIVTRVAIHVEPVFDRSASRL